MAVTILSCYFLPFLFFFITQIAFPRSILGCVLGIAALSICSLILYFQQKAKIQAPTVQIKYIEKVAAAAPRPLPKPLSIDPALFIFKGQPGYSLKAGLQTGLQSVLQEKDQALLSQKDLFTEELEKKNQALFELQKVLQEKESELARQAKELQDVKFELYTLLRIEAYSPKENLTAASF